MVVTELNGMIGGLTHSSLGRPASSRVLTRAVPQKGAFTPARVRAGQPNGRPFVEKEKLTPPVKSQLLAKLL